MSFCDFIYVGYDRVFLLPKGSINRRVETQRRIPPRPRRPLRFLFLSKNHRYCIAAGLSMVVYVDAEHKGRVK